MATATAIILACLDFACHAVHITEHDSSMHVLMFACCRSCKTMLKGQDDLKDQKWKHGNPADNPDPPRVRVRAKSPRPAMNASLRKNPKSEATAAPEPKSILKSKKHKPEECAEPPAKKKKRDEVDVQNEEQGKDLSKKEAKKAKKDTKDKKANKEEPPKKKKQADDLQEILDQFEDSGPEIDEEDFELELRKWQEERATARWEEQYGSATGNESEQTLDYASLPAKKAELVDPSQEDTQPLEPMLCPEPVQPQPIKKPRTNPSDPLLALPAPPPGMEHNKVDLSSVPLKHLLGKPEPYIPRGASNALLPGLHEAFESDEDFEDDVSLDPEDNSQCEEPNVAPPAPSKTEKKIAPAAEQKINSKTHKKFWSKLDRLIDSSGRKFPNMAKMWQGDNDERNKLLRQFVLSNGVAEKVESDLVWRATAGNKRNRRKALLTVKQMRGAPHRFPKAKVRWIVANRQPVEDEDCPGVKSAWKYWCTVETVIDDYNVNESGPLHVCVSMSNLSCLDCGCMVSI